MIEGYEIVKHLKDDYSLVKDASQDFCYGIYEHSTDSIVGFKYYKIESLSKDFLIGKDKDNINVHLLTSTGTVIDEVCFGSYEFFGFFKNIAFFNKKIDGVKDRKTLLLIDSYKDRISGEMFTFKVTYKSEDEVFTYRGIEVYPPANHYTESFNKRHHVIVRKALMRFKEQINR